ncbi:MAG: anthranilate synthase component I [Rickettsiales bacterium]|nr:anthranilate synthase component I [Rickettsiales bacterium]
MTFQPTSELFSTHYEKGEAQLVWTIINADMITPVAAMRRLAHMSPYHLFFESVEGGETRARYSIIALDPDLIWRCQTGGVVDICRNAHLPSSRFEPDTGEVFASFRAILAESTVTIPPELPPMAAGLFGYMGYDMVRYMETLPDANPDTLGIPESIYIRPRVVVIFDSVKDQAILVTSVRPANALSASTAYQEAKTRLHTIHLALEQELPLRDQTYDTHGFANFFHSHVDEETYKQRVNHAKEYIRAGDIFQMVPSRRLSKAFDLPPLSFYRALRHLNPSPYLFYTNMNGFVLAGSRPEILVRVLDDTITIRPIAGTRKRGSTPQEDKALEKDLLADQKELAEHLMLLDLARNDVGRAAIPGSVRVTEQMIIERYSHVMHIVSNVEGTLKPGCDALDALIGGFPAGTVSGAPKIRAMEIIDELEQERRSFYGGTVGYFSANGSMDTCIALRTALIKDKMIYIQAGGGVVADSDPQAEFEETQNKANALIRAADMAVTFT